MDVKLFILGAALIVCSSISDVSSDSCSLLQFIKKDLIPTQCPLPILGIGNEYCCYNFDQSAYCCDITGKAINATIMAVLLIIAVAVVLSILSCILLFFRSLFR